MSSKKQDFYLVVGAYVSWGLLPLYWKLLGSVPAPTVLMHRVLWSAVFLAMLLAWRGELLKSLREMRRWSHLRRVLPSALFICTNWLTYVWAMGHHRIMESGLGYFLCPIFSIALAAAVLGEKLSRQQIVGLLVVTSGVLLKVLAIGQVPWVALLLAGSFALYVTMRKSYAQNAVTSLFHEVLLALPLVSLGGMFLGEPLHMSSYDGWTALLLVSSGPVTALPLLMLVHGLKAVSLSTSAILQYLSPTLTLLMGTFAGESLLLSDWLALAVIWLGIGICLSRRVSRLPSPHVREKLMEAANS